MLTKELLRFHSPAGRVKPLFIDPADRALLGFAAGIRKTYHDFLGAPRSEILEALEPRINSQRDLKLARGLWKLYDDQCIFTGDSSCDWAAMRRTLFAHSSRLISNVQEGKDDTDFRTEVFAAAGESVVPLSDNIYADLPDYERLSELPEITPELLLERYNVVLVQSLVLYAESLELAIEERDSAKMRRFFKYLKFFRLLADVSGSSRWEEGTPSAVRLKIDGPASILENSQKYGLQLASFFPALCRLKRWRIASEVKVQERSLKLKLDETSALKCHYANFGAYIPEEIRMFHDAFRKMETTWKIIDRVPYLRMKNNQLIFPDFSFRNSATGREFDLELFHPWHAGRIAERLDEIASDPESTLLIGVDRACVRGDDALQERIRAADGCFLFRNFPGVENVRKALDAREMRDASLL